MRIQIQYYGPRRNAAGEIVENDGEWKTLTSFNIASEQLHTVMEHATRKITAEPLDEDLPQVRITFGPDHADDPDYSSDTPLLIADLDANW